MQRELFIRRLFRGSVLLVLLVASQSTPAAIQIFFGRDDGVGAGGPRPNAEAAHQAFLAAIGGSASSSAVITFEGLNAGAVIPTDPPLDLGLGVGLRSNGACCAAIGATDSTVDGYNTTAGGSRFLQLTPPTIDQHDIDMVLSFAFPINSLGFFVTGSQLPGPDGCPSSCGSLEVLGGTNLEQRPGENDARGGVVFFGFIDRGARYREITLREHGPFAFEQDPGVFSGSPDNLGIDDITIARVPVPSTLVLLGAGFVGLVAMRRRQSPRGNLREPLPGPIN